MAGVYADGGGVARQPRRAEVKGIPCTPEPQTVATKTGAAGPASPEDPIGCRGQLAAAALTGPGVVRCERYRELARHHLGTLRALFTKFTGLFSRLCWTQSWPQRWSNRELPTRSRLCRTRMAGQPLLAAQCGQCAARHLALALRSGHSGHRFTCRLGVQNYWLPILVRGCPVGLAFVQAAAPPLGSEPSRPGAKGSRRGGASPTSTRATQSMGRADFREAAKLLRLVFQHVETAVLADLRKCDLTRAEKAVLELQTVAARLRGELNGLVPAFNKLGPELQFDNHSDRIVQAAMEYIHQHYSHPFTLRQCAERLRLNPAYLSAQFSRAVGLPFKSYLTEVRLEKARALLGDLSRNVADVAYAVGYASENRFRLAFKKATGLAPRIWRETLRMPVAAWLVWWCGELEFTARLQEFLAFGLV